MWIELTNVCNLRCPVCPNSTDTTSERGFMDIELYERLIAQCRGELNDANLSHRGESLFHPAVLPAIERAARAGIGVRLHTNATVLTPRLSRALLRTRLGLLSFSFDGPGPEEYEAMRVGACYEEVLGNILRFLEEKQRAGKRRPYTILQVIDTSGGAKARELELFRRRFDGLPLDKFYVKAPHNWAGNAPLETTCAAGDELSPCTFPWYSLTVLWDGTVVPCPQDWYARLPLGNIREQSLREIWNGRPLQELRRRMARLEVEGLEPCCSCDRLRRPTRYGIPTENLKAFLAETIAGYAWVGKLVRR
jgi:radical SAM protein with 4Fe4S-binding SPASM domain